MYTNYFFVGFQVSATSKGKKLKCKTNHLTSFGGSFAVPMNKPDLGDSAFTKLNENPLVFSVMVSCMCLYLVLLIWAKRADKEDELKVFYIRPCSVYSMVDGSRQGFSCYVGGKKIKIKSRLPNTVGGKTLLNSCMSEERKKKKD